MIIRNFKRKTILLSSILIITGITISFIGFAMGNFDLDIFKTEGVYKWYRTINFDGDGPSFQLGH